MLAPFFNSLSISLISVQANTVAVVVPSPASSTVLDAPCLNILIPVLMNGSALSTSLATETPSFVIRPLSIKVEIITVLPFGPNVQATGVNNSCAAANNAFLASLP